MNLYQRLGYLVLGSRLRRLSENFLSEINKVYQDEGIDFDANWFPVFYLLSKNGSLSIKELSEQTEVSHPAASQLITNLKNKNLVTSIACSEDGRRQLVQLMPEGKALLQQILPIWDAILLAMNELESEDAANAEFLTSIGALENAFKNLNLAKRINLKLRNTLTETSNG